VLPLHVIVANPTLPHALPFKSVPVPSSSDLCALCVSAFSSHSSPPNISTFKPFNLQAAPSPTPSLAPLVANVKHKSFACHSYKKHPGWGVPSIFKSFPRSNHAFTSKPHRITSFAYPHPLTPIESYSCKKQGEGAPNLFSKSDLPTLLPPLHPLKPILQMAHPYLCTCKKGPAAREPRYQPCAAS
jgi:hypothetical protein